MVTVLINRNDDSKGSVHTYEVPYQYGMNLLEILKYINEKVDPTLVFRHSCRIGLCGICQVKVNGKIKLACTTVVRDGEKILVEPMNHNIIRDLVCKMTVDGDCV